MNKAIWNRYRKNFDKGLRKGLLISMFSICWYYTEKTIECVKNYHTLYEWRQSTTFISVRWAWVNAALLLLLILNVFFYHCQAVFTYRCNEVAVWPEVGLPVPFLQQCITVGFPYKSWRLSFHDAYKLTRTSERICLKQDVNVVSFSIHFKNIEPSFPESIPYGRIHRCFDFSFKDRVSVFCYKHQMVLQ